MSDDTTEPDDTSIDSAAAETPVDTPQGGEAPAAPPAPVMDADAALRELERTRREAAKYRTRARELEEAEQARRDAELSELEKAQAEAARLKQEANDAREHARRVAADAALMAAANHFNDPSDAVALAASQVEFDEHGTPTNIADLVAQLAKSKPHLVKPTPGASGGNPPRPGGSGGPSKTDAERLREILQPAATSWWPSSRNAS